MIKSKIKLHGFNNLTKTLSFNIYDICYAKTEKHQQEYIEYIDEAYNAERLTKILTDVTRIIGANILNIACQDYDPQGASVTMLISELPLKHSDMINSESPGPLPEAVVAHLDKSHITVHTYPESHPDNGISTFRADIDVSTCGVISPLKALNYLIHSFESDILTLDYRVRGFTRDINGTKHYIDHPINSIQTYIAEDTRNNYAMIDVNVYQENVFHTKMLLNEFNLDNYLFGSGQNDFSEEELFEIEQRLRHEMLEIFYGRNIVRMPKRIKKEVKKNAILARKKAYGRRISSAT
jgi:S-adenosylmethionine decarboxylase